MKNPESDDLLRLGRDVTVWKVTLPVSFSYTYNNASAAHPVQYLYGVDGDGPFTTEIKVTETGGTNEKVKTSTDLNFNALGHSHPSPRPLPIEGRGSRYAAASAPYPFSLSTFNNKGQLTNQIDPDGVMTLLAYYCASKLK